MSLEQITDANFESRVLQADVPIVVDFWAAWCGPCRMLAPILEQAADFYGDQVRIVKLDTEKHRATPAKFGISSLPTVLVFKNGEMVDAMVGVRPPDQLKSMIDRALKGPGFFSRLKSKLSGGDSASD